MKRYDKALYYEMYKPYNVYKNSKDEYCSYQENQALYDKEEVYRELKEIEIIITSRKGIKQ